MEVAKCAAGGAFDPLAAIVGFRNAGGAFVFVRLGKLDDDAAEFGAAEAAILGFRGGHITFRGIALA